MNAEVRMMQTARGAWENVTGYGTRWDQWRHFKQQQKETISFADQSRLFYIFAKPYKIKYFFKMFLFVAWQPFNSTFQSFTAANVF